MPSELQTPKLEHITRACKRCGALMQIKVNRTTREQFFGCTAHRPDDWDSCQYTEPLPESIRLKRQGQKGMFDDE
jgi:ssDNA-binding Zn-finger/Zn-ribbon topoisomerase 1